MEGGAISAELEVEGQQTFSREGVTPWTVVNQKRKKKKRTGGIPECAGDTSKVLLSLKLLT